MKNAEKTLYWKKVLENCGRKVYDVKQKNEICILHKNT